MLAPLALVAALAQAPPAEPVAIDVIARDARNRPVETLTASDVELREDGAPQSITGVELVRKPRLIGIYLDEYYVSAASTPAVKAALRRFIDSLDAGDEVAILRPLDSLLTIRLTTDRAALQQAVDAFEGRRGDYTPRTAFERNYVVSDRARADTQRAQSTWSTLNALTLNLANRHAGRTSVLLVSEQADPVVHRRGYEGLPTSSSVMRAADRSNVSIYVFDPRDAAAREASPDEGPNLLRVLADDTDGALISGPEAADAGLREMLRDASSYYLVSYRSVHARDGLFHTVDVGVKKPGVTVRARNGFWAPTPEEIQRADLVTAGSATLPPIKFEAPRHASPLVRPWFGVARGDGGKVRLTFVWEPRGAVPGDRRVKVAARLVVKAVGADGVTVFEGAVRDGTSAAFDVPPGRVTLTSSVEDAAAQKIDSDVRDVMVRDLKGAVALGTPIVFRARTAKEMRELRADPSATPTVAREFSRAEQLLVRVPAYAPGRPPALAATLISPAGRRLRQLAVAEASAAAPLPAVDVPLAGLPPGEYSIEIAAKAPAGTATETLAFRVVD